MIATPQVVLSLDLAESLTFFENSRRGKPSIGQELPGEKSGSFSQFLGKYGEKLSFVFTSNEKGNLLNFKTSFGNGDAKDQPTFRLEIMDPGAEFEAAFFGTFMDGGSNYAEAINRFILERNKHAETLAKDSRQAIRDGIRQGGERARLEESLADFNIDDQEALARASNKMTNINKLGTEGGRATYATLEEREEAANQDEVRIYVHTGEYTTKSYGPRTTARVKERKYLTYEEARVSTQRLHITRRLLTDSPDVLGDIAKEGLKGVGESQSYNTVAEEIDRLSAMPFMQDFWISFGIGDDIKNYSPATLVKLVKIEYGLTNNNVRKFTLMLVPSSGMLNLETAPSLMGELLSSNRLKYKVNETVVDKKGNTMNPMSSAIRLIHKAYSKALGGDTQCQVLLYNLKQSLKKRFAEALIATMSQRLYSKYKISIKGTEELQKLDSFKTLYNYATEITAKSSKGRKRGHNIKSDDTINAIRELVGTKDDGVTSELSEEIADNANTILVDPAKADQIKYSQFDIELFDTKNNFEVFSFYIKVLETFYKSIGVTFTATFLQAGNIKVSYFPFAKMQTRWVSQHYKNQREWLKGVMDSFTASISLSEDSPFLLKNAADATVRLVDRTGRNPRLLNFPEISFLKLWWWKRGRVTSIKNVAFLVTSEFYSALVKGLGNDFITETDEETPLTPQQEDDLWDFVDTYTEFFTGEPEISPIKYLHDPYAYLTEESRSLFGDIGLRTNDTRGSLKDDSDKFLDHLKTNRIPVLVYGLKNSNILNFNFDLNMWWAQFLLIVPESLKNSLMSAAIGDPGDNHELKATAQAVDYYTAPGGIEKLDKMLDDIWEKANTYVKGLIVPDDAGPKRSRARHSVAERRHEVTSSPISTVAVLMGANTPGATNASLASNISDAIVEKDPEKRLELMKQVLPDKEAFKRRVKVTILLALKAKRGGAVFQAKSSEDQNVLPDIMRIQNSLHTKGGFRGKLTTLPIFQILTPTMIGKAALLYFVEPQIFSNDKVENKVPYNTWLSGEYWILGYEAVISNGQVTSSFNVVKKPYLKGIEG